jgi:hypothetical protein
MQSNAVRANQRHRGLIAAPDPSTPGAANAYNPAGRAPDATLDAWSNTH